MKKLYIGDSYKLCVHKTGSMWLWNVCRKEGTNTEGRSELGHRFLKIDSMKLHKCPTHLSFQNTGLKSFHFFIGTL